MSHHSRRKVLASGLAAGLTAAVSLTVAACDSTSDAEPSPGPTAPDGYTLTEVPGFSFSLAVPAGWTTLTHDDLDDDELVKTVAGALNQDPGSLRESVETFHLISVDADATDFAENLVVSQYELEDGLPPEEELAEVTEGHQVDYSDYAQRTTGSGGQAALYTAGGARSSGGSFNIAFLAVRGDAGTAAGTVTFVLIEAASADRARELADVVIASV
ncbi:hypothetical protein [Actinomyces qiguomingii]|uniref:hypothetical protein n=1 Tax=Actinomyces qiguomingii TaxID=2057800 RepID=UPI000CA0131A|nr:hypothetical protein [Actinomyces qiguomingii]